MLYAADPYRALSDGVTTARRSRRIWADVFVCLILIAAGTNKGTAQSLNWEGQTGIFVTPLAYAAPSSDKNFGKPVLAYHYLDAGSVLGGFHQASVTIGAFGHLEFGYTRSVHQDGTTAGLSNLWTDGFNTFHGKLNFLRENVDRGWLPALSIGFVVRSQVRNVGGVIAGKDTTNQDFYAVATKTITRLKIPLVLNAGYKATNASLLGLVGNTPNYEGRGFGAAAFAFRGPARSTIMVGSEFLQEPRTVENLPGAVVPTTITYAVRIVPAGAFPAAHGWGEESPRLSIDLGIAQAANNIMPGVKLQARRQFALGISYAF
jgi:Protein of unknown function (DUF3034)